MSHILVIGGTRGIGKIIADRLSEFMKVTVIGRTAEKYAVDVRDADAYAEVVNEIHIAEGHITGVVFVPRGPLSQIPIAMIRAHRLHSGHGLQAMVVVNSIASLYVADDQPVEYHAMKAAMAGAVRQLSTGATRINGVCPGKIREDGSGDCMPIEVADVIAFLLSPASAAINGQHIVLDRGRSLRLP